MMELNSLLCPTDFSEPAEVALEQGIRIAVEANATLHLVHVVQPQLPPVTATAVGGAELVDLQDNLVTHAEEQVTKLIREQVRPAGVTAVSKVLVGSPADTVVAYADEQDIELIVTATHGWTGWRRFLFGSVAEKVVRMANCPVLVLPRGEEKEHD